MDPAKKPTDTCNQGGTHIEATNCDITVNETTVVQEPKE